MLGFVAVGTLMLVPMGLASYLFVKRGLDHTHLEVVEIEKLPNGQLKGKTDFVRGHDHEFTIDAGEEYGLTEFNRGHRHVVQKISESEYSIGAPIDNLRARVPNYGEIQFYDRSGAPKDAGINVGQETSVGGYGQAGIARVIGAF